VESVLPRTPKHSLSVRGVAPRWHILGAQAATQALVGVSGDSN